jgi:hypothetical protein
MLGIGYFEVQPWTPLKNYWFLTYFWATVAQQFHTGHSPYRLLVEVPGNHEQPIYPLDEDVVPGRTRTAEGRMIPLALTEEAYQQGKQLVLLRSQQLDNAKLQADLQSLYYGKSLNEMTLAPLGWGLGIFSLAFVLSIPIDRERAIERREGRRLKGPEILTVTAFNRKLAATGMGILNILRRTFWEWLLRRDARMVRIPRNRECNHLAVMGDSGTGKSVIIDGLLAQIEHRGEAAVIFDSTLHFTELFYNQSRGDTILNPLDERMPYWSPSDEVQHEAEALTIATSLFPDTHRENPFFVEGPRKVFAYLLTLRPSPEELVWWLSHEHELDRRLKGTELAAMIYPGASAQRAGMLASLNMVADSLKMLPRRQDTSRSWTAAEWSKHRQGWIFITSTPEVRKRLLPLTSLWLDLLVLRLMNQGRPGTRPVWFILDELASLQRLPQLHTAITENRKSNNPVVLGFQGRSQLEARYGLDSEAMLSQPATKVFLRTSEPKAAKWISETIGEVELERVKETRTDGQERNSRSFHLERIVQPLIMPSEVEGLPDLEGYIKHGNLVTRFRTTPIERGAMARGFIPRRPMLPPLAAPDGTNPAPGKNGAPAQELTPGDGQQQSILEND